MVGNKSDEKQSEKRAHKADDSDNSKHKNKPSFTTLGSSPFAAKFEAADDEGTRHTRWRNRFQQLCGYKEQFGDCLVPQQYAANPKLGKWVSTQRTRYREYSEEKSDSTTAEHIRALEGIGFNWGISKTGLTSIWSVRFQQMCEFKAQFGHCLVPQQYAANAKLGNWVKNQRRNYRWHQEGKPSAMTEERIRELESVGFEWGTSKSRTGLASIWGV
jgi:hypothetical protein